MRMVGICIFKKALPFLEKVVTYYNYSYIWAKVENDEPS